MSPPPFLVTVLSIVTATSNPTVLARILILTAQEFAHKWKEKCARLDGFSFKDDTLQYTVWVKSLGFQYVFEGTIYHLWQFCGRQILCSSRRLQRWPNLIFNQRPSLCQHNYISQVNIQYHYWACYLIKVWLWTITWTGMNKLSIYHSLKDLKVHHLSLVGLSLILCP